MKDQTINLRNVLSCCGLIRNKYKSRKRMCIKCKNAINRVINHLKRGVKHERY